MAKPKPPETQAPPVPRERLSARLRRTTRYPYPIDPNRLTPEEINGRCAELDALLIEYGLQKPGAEADWEPEYAECVARERMRQKEYSEPQVQPHGPAASQDDAS